MAQTPPAARRRRDARHTVVSGANDAVLLYVAMISLCFVGARCVSAAGSPQTLPRPQSDLVATTLKGAPVVFELTQTSTLKSDGVTWDSSFAGGGVRVISAGAVTVGDNAYIIGGGNDVGAANCTVWNGSTLSSCPDMPSPRGQLGVATVGTSIYAIGGYAAKGWDIVEVFDTSSSTWKTGLPALPTPRYGLSCEAVAAVIYCIGGIAYHTPSVNTVEAYDVSAGRWLPKASMPTARAFFASTVYEGSIYVLGGDDGTNKLTLVEAYSPATNSWATAAPLPSPARSHFAATTYSAGILMLGGSVDKGLYEHDIDNADLYTVSA